MGAHGGEPRAAQLSFLWRSGKTNKRTYQAAIPERPEQFLRRRVLLFGEPRRCVRDIKVDRVERRKVRFVPQELSDEDLEASHLAGSCRQGNDGPPSRPVVALAAPAIRVRSHLDAVAPKQRRRRRRRRRPCFGAGRTTVPRHPVGEPPVALDRRRGGPGERRGGTTAREYRGCWTDLGRRQQRQVRRCRRRRRHQEEGGGVGGSDKEKARSEGQQSHFGRMAQHETVQPYTRGGGGGTRGRSCRGRRGASSRRRDERRRCNCGCRPVPVVAAVATPETPRRLKPHIVLSSIDQFDIYYDC